MSSSEYWRGLAAGTYFADRRLDACIGVIHQDIVGIWNFRDDDEVYFLLHFILEEVNYLTSIQILRRRFFKNAILLLVQDLADPNGPTPGSNTYVVHLFFHPLAIVAHAYISTKNLGAIKAALDVATPISGPLGPVVASVGLSVMFVKWLSDMYNSTCGSRSFILYSNSLPNSPGVLRCIMGYIVDVTIVLEILFWLKIAQPQIPYLFEDDIIAAFNHYQGSAGHLEVHEQIRKYVDNMTLIDHANPDDNTHIEVERLINSHRRILIDTISSGTKSDEKPIAEPLPPASENQLGSGPSTSTTRSGQVSFARQQGRFKELKRIVTGAL